MASKLASDPEQSLIFERFLPATEVLEVCEKSGHRFRDRIYTPVTTLWMFLGQSLSPDHVMCDLVHLRCKSPAMVRKEVDTHLIPDNLIRDLIVDTSLIYETSPKSLSHKGAVQALNAFAEKLHSDSDHTEALEAAFYESIMEHSVGDRKPRVHPREIKRRPKPYKLMQKPRHAARKPAA